MGKVLSYEERNEIFQEKLKNRYPDYRVVEGHEFIANDEFVILEHVPTGEQWKTKPRYLDGKRQAPGVARANKRPGSNRDRYTTASFRKKFYNKFSKEEFIVVGEYVTNSTPIEFKHLYCGKSNVTSPSNAMKSNLGPCKFCFGKYKRSIEEYEEVLKFRGIEDYKIISIETKDSQTFALFEHLSDECEHNQFSMRISDMYSAHSQRCPICSIRERATGSKKFKEILDYLDNKEIEYKREVSLQDLFYKKSLRIDLYIPSIDIYIEYDGIQHANGFIIYNESEREAKLSQLRDGIKDMYFDLFDLKLYRIKHGEDHVARIKDILSENGIDVNND